MKSKLQDEIKKEIGYTSKHHNCQMCKHFEEVENPHLDRSWNQVCNLFKDTLGTMSVTIHSRCNKFEQK